MHQGPQQQNVREKDSVRSGGDLGEKSGDGVFFLSLSLTDSFYFHHGVHPVGEFSGSDLWWLLGLGAGSEVTRCSGREWRRLQSPHSVGPAVSLHSVPPPASPHSVGRARPPQFRLVTLTQFFLWLRPRTQWLRPQFVLRELLVQRATGAWWRWPAPFLRCSYSRGLFWSTFLPGSPSTSCFSFLRYFGTLLRASGPWLRGGLRVSCSLGAGWWSGGGQALGFPSVFDKSTSPNGTEFSNLSK